MGNQLSGVAPAQILPVERYLTELPDFHFVQSLGSTRFMKVAVTLHSEGQVVAKVFVVHDPLLQLKPYKDHIEEVSHSLRTAVSCCCFQKILLTEKCAILLRQFGKETLYDRLSTRPFLSVIEKRWIAFQLLKALEQCTSANVCHGDIKSENVLVNSWNWISLTDFASFKPTYLPHDNPADFSYFFDTSRRRACYIAPERFVEGSELNNSASNNLVILPEEQCSALQLTPAMDVFSLGCVILELMTDGATAFDFSQMLAFRRGQYNPQPLLEKIDCLHLRELIAHMIQKDPRQRWSASQYLAWQRGKAFPEVFYSFLWSYCQQFVTHPLMPFERWITQLKSTMPRILSYLGNEERKDSHPALVIILGIVTALLRSLKHTSSKLTAFCLLEELSVRLPSELILDRILPFILCMMSDIYARVKARAVRSLAICLNAVTSLPQTDLQVFSEFVFPKIPVLLMLQAGLARDPSTLVRLSLAENVSSLAMTAERFLRYASENFIIDPQVQEGCVDQSAVAFDSASEQRSLRDGFQEIVVSLLCDQSSAVKQQLVCVGLGPLAAFFGKHKASDILLSHMITFLNDKSDWELRAAFYNCVPQLAAFIGWQSSHILKPLLQQGLCDTEEMVVFRSLVCLSELARLNLLRKPLVYDLVNDSVAFLCHPNEWIRMACTAFICFLSMQLKIADVHCKIMPPINPYLKQPLIKLDHQFVFLQTLCQPIPRPVFDLLVKSPKLSEMLEFLREKNLAKQLSHRSEQQQGNRFYPEDQQLAQFYQKLLNQGLTDEAEERVLAFREILSKMLKLRNSIKNDLSPTEEGYPGVVSLPTIGRAIDLAAPYRSTRRTHEPRSVRTNKRSDAAGSADWQQMYAAEETRQFQAETLSVMAADEDSVSSGDGRLRNGKFGHGNHETSVEVTSEQREGRFGRLESCDPGEDAVLQEKAWCDDALCRPEANANSNATSVANSHNHNADPFVSVADSNSLSDSTDIGALLLRPEDGAKHLLDANDGEAAETISIESKSSLPSSEFDIGHSYAGAVEEAAADAFGHLSDCRRAVGEFLEFKRSEFCRLFKAPAIKSVSSAFPATDWRPQGKLVAHLHEHKAAVNRLSVHANGHVFASASSDGSVKLWDAEKMEGKHMTNKSSWSYAKQGGKIRSATFATGNGIVCASDNGSLQLLKIESGNDGSVVNSLVFDANVEGPPILAEAYFNGMSDIVVCLTHHGHVVCWDTRLAVPALKFQNACDHGLVTAMCVDACDQQWICLGTDRGYLVPWDLRFVLPVNIIKHPSRRRVERIWCSPWKPSSVFASVYGNGEVSLWDLETSSRSLAVWPCERSVLSYQQMKGLTTTALWYNGSLSQQPDVSVLISGDTNANIHVWDLNDLQKSGILAGDQKMSYRPQLVDGVQVIQAVESTAARQQQQPQGCGAPGKSASALGGVGFTGGWNPLMPKSPMEQTPSIVHHDTISDLVMTKASQWFLASASRDGVIKLWK